MTETLRLFNVDFSNVTTDRFLEELESRIKRNQKGYVVTPNVDHIVKLQRDKMFKKSYEGAGFVLVDGAPILFVSRLLGKPLLEKISGSDLFLRLLSFAGENDLKIFLLGAGADVNRDAAEKIRTECPEVRIAGRCAPSAGFENNDRENQELVRIINQAEPDLLFIFLGTPKQENWICHNIDNLRIKFAFCFGAALDFYSGYAPRAPAWIQRAGLEWLLRLIHNPKRLAKRYLVDDFLPFLWISGREICARLFKK